MTTTIIIGIIAIIAILFIVKKVKNNKISSNLYEERTYHKDNLDGFVNTLSNKNIDSVDIEVFAGLIHKRLVSSWLYNCQTRSNLQGGILMVEDSSIQQAAMIINLKKFYISSCKKIVNQRVKIYQEQLRVKPKSIQVDESKVKWGSCTSNKKITFNYKLAMAPLESIDYVVVHELCHIIHMNHERSFWRKVGSILPDYKKRQEYLQRYGATMTL